VSKYKRLELGWIIADGRYICDGCMVAEPHEHRCHHGDGSGHDGRDCECEECNSAEDDSGRVDPVMAWSGLLILAMFVVFVLADQLHWINLGLTEVIYGLFLVILIAVFEVVIYILSTRQTGSSDQADPHRT